MVYRAANDGDTSVPVYLDQMAHRGVHAPPVLHQHHGCPTERLLHADYGQRVEAAAELRHPLGTRVDPQDARPHHQAVECLVRHQVIDRVELLGVPWCIQRTAAETDQVAPVGTGGVDGTEPLLGEHFHDILGEHAHHRAGPTSTTGPDGTR